MTWSFPVGFLSKSQWETSFALDNELEDSDEEEQVETQLGSLGTNTIGQVQVGLPEIIPQEEEVLQMPQVLQVYTAQLTVFNESFSGGR